MRQLQEKDWLRWIQRFIQIPLFAGLQKAAISDAEATARRKFANKATKIVRYTPNFLDLMKEIQEASKRFRQY